MLSSIHPLGERARNNQWSITVISFTLASTTAGALVGTALGAVGALALGGVSETMLLAVTGLAVIAAATLDLRRVDPPGPSRQVNETWIGHYRGWVYGGAFGAELGVGVATYVVTWGVYATFVAEIATASPATGALVGAVFGFGRSLALLLAGLIDRPSRLTAFHNRMAQLGLPVHRGTAFGSVTAGLIATAGALL